jgi:TPP-dependent 2-oxoacid decarboxylase
MKKRPQQNQMDQDIERELARYLDRAKNENKPAEVMIAGNLYRLVPVDDDIQMTDEPNANYDPQKMSEAIHAAAGTMKGVNRDELLADLRAERGQDSIGRPAD